MTTFHRPVVMGTRGMVATGHPLASDAGLDVLKSGGNAMDAALCASAVLSVVKSYHCGLGGDLFGIFYSANENKVYVLNGSGRSPKKIRRELFSAGIPHRGILAASTPGTADGWLEMATKLGTRGIGDLLKPAIEYAETGFPVFRHLAEVIRASQKALGADPAWSEIFLPEGSPPEIGDLLVQKDLAATLAAIASGCRDAFYEGEIARSIIRASERRGGCFSLDDFAEHRSRWDEPLSTTYRKHDIYVPPPNSYGLFLLLQVRGHNTPAYLALQIRAKDMAWRAGDFWIADPDQYRCEEFAEFLRKFPPGLHGNCPERGNSLRQ